MITSGQLFELDEKFASLTIAHSDGLGDEETKETMDLVLIYSNLMSTELILELTDLTTLAPKLNRGSIGVFFCSPQSGTVQMFSITS